MSTPDLNAATQVVRPLTSPALREIPESLARLQSRALMVGAAGLLLCGVGLLLDPVRLLQSYLVAWLYWSGLALGALAVVLLQFLSGGAWGMIIRRILEAATRTLPLLTLLFLPLLLGMETLYPWARPEEVGRVLAEGAEKARAVARETMNEVRGKMGLDWRTAIG